MMAMVPKIAAVVINFFCHCLQVVQFIIQVQKVIKFNKVVQLDSS
jgi:hypothetical protein